MTEQGKERCGYNEMLKDGLVWPVQQPSRETDKDPYRYTDKDCITHTQTQTKFFLAERRPITAKRNGKIKEKTDT